MNIHPVFVHFPIALLSLYAIFECIRFRKLMASREWFFVKAAFLLIGSAGALVAALTGSIAKRLYEGNRHIMSIHSSFASGTIVIFGLLCIVYFIVLLDYFFGQKLRTGTYGQTWEKVAKIAQALIGGWLVPLLAIVGFCAVSITGALGGIIVYGTDFDIFTQLVGTYIIGQ